MSETAISPVILYMSNKPPIIICKFCGMINHIADKCMSHGPAFQLTNILQIFSQYNDKHGPTKKVEPIDWEINPPISQYCHQHTSPSVRTYIKCTEPISKDQKQNLSSILSYFYENNYT